MKENYDKKVWARVDLYYGKFLILIIPVCLGERLYKVESSDVEEAWAVESALMPSRVTGHLSWCTNTRGKGQATAGRVGPLWCCLW